MRRDNEKLDACYQKCTSQTGHSWASCRKACTDARDECRKACVGK